MSSKLEERKKFIQAEMEKMQPPEETFTLFKEALLLGYISSEIRFLKSGDCEFAIHVPQKYTQACEDLRYAIGVPIELYLKVWENDW